ncbi:ABC transporter substrate-binding protein [Frankia gtarii]|uniref:ABC transporter substrate-binding protein n=1 Tax=Frankia gtarii TaxID=2950102 RepID=UPI0021BF541F|nr:ABC transporter substrate-binding protein [Frankia gtarii]
MRLLPLRFTAAGRLAARPRTRTALTGVLLATSLVAAACGGGSSGGGSSGGGTVKADSALLGPAKAATGTPVKIGWIGTGRTQAVDASAEEKSAQAAADYANAHLGGLRGHQIQIVSCEDKSVPADAQACGNTFVREKVSAVAGGSPGQADPWIKIVSPAGIPTVLNLVATQTALSTKNVFLLGNPLGPFGTAAAYAREAKLSSAVVLVIDVPAASGPAKALSPIFFANAGSKAKVIAIPPGTADMTPQIQSAQKDKPALYHVTGDPTFCASAIKAIKALGIKATITALDRCVGTDKGASIPGGFEGVKIMGQANQDPTTAEYKLYSAVVDAYGKGLKTNDAYTISGYQGMLGLIRSVNAVAGTDVTPAGVAKAIQTAPATPYPIGGGATFQCNGKASPVSPNICSTTGFVADASKTGTLSNFRTIDATGIYKLGAN